MTVVRNQGYSRGGFNVRERHNERKNEFYGNSDIDQSREHLNIHYLQQQEQRRTTKKSYGMEI
jgi:hypothetical protein